MLSAAAADERGDERQQLFPGAATGLRMSSHLLIRHTSQTAALHYKQKRGEEMRKGKERKGKRGSRGSECEMRNERGGGAGLAPMSL